MPHLRLPTRRTAPLLVSLVFGSASLSGCPDPEMPADAAVSLDGHLEDSPALPPDAHVFDPFPTACENVNALYCLAPWPSSRYLVEDRTTRTGFRVSIPREAMPPNRRGVRVDPAQWNDFDGFSPATSMMTVVSGPIDTSVLADELHIADSLLSTSATVLLEVREGGGVSRVAHYAEVDSWPTVDVRETPLYIRPAARLRANTRYIVAIRGLRSASGTPLEPSSYFQALRDGTPLPEAADLESRRAHFEEIFSILGEAGVARNDLFEAWDFITASDERIYADMVAIRDEAIRLNEAGDNCRITVASIEERPASDVFRRIHGTVRVALFLNGTDPGGASPESVNLARIRRDAMGRPAQNAETPFVEVPFVATIPRSVERRIAEGGGPVRLLTYGHGLFGSRSETHSGWFRDTIERLQMVGIAVDWWGMSEEDVPRVTRALNDFSTFVATPERLHQGVTNFLVLTHSFLRAGEGRCEVIGTSEVPRPFHVTPMGGDPVLVYDPSERYYYGNSQGGIMGLTLAGLSTDIIRFVSGVGGMSYSTMIPRSINWQFYGAIMQNGYPRHLDRAFLMTAAQSQWDLAEPSTYAAFVRGATLPCSLGPSDCPDGRTPAHEVLMMIGQDDAQVATLTADTAARTIGIPVLVPSPYVPFGVETTPGGEGVGSAMAIFAIPGVPMLPLGTRDPGRDNAAHEGVRRSAAALRMMDRFFRADGIVEMTCDGVCDPD